MSKNNSTKTRKKSFGARVNESLLNKIDNYILQQNKRGISLKKIDLIETAFIEYLEKRGAFNE